MKKAIFGISTVLLAVTVFFAGATFNEVSRQEPEPTVYSEPTPLPFIGDSVNGLPIVIDQSSKQEAISVQQPAAKAAPLNAGTKSAAFDPYKYALDVNAYSGAVEYPTIEPYSFGGSIKPFQVEYPKVQWQTNTGDCHVAFLYCD